MILPWAPISISQSLLSSRRHFIWKTRFSEFAESWGRCSFETVTKSTEDFVHDFCDKLLHLKQHDFIAKQQSKFFSDKKTSLLENEAIMWFFSKNYPFIVQDQAQGFYRNNSKATVYLCVIYYIKEDEEEVC